MKPRQINVKDIIAKIDGISSNICQKKQKWKIAADTAILLENAGEDPLKRPIEKHVNYGIVVVDKPPGPTSHEVVAWIKKLLGVKKAGHGGTLEPVPY